VGILFHALQTKGDPAKICRGHRATPKSQSVSHLENRGNIEALVKILRDSQPAQTNSL